MWTFGVNVPFNSVTPIKTNMTHGVTQEGGELALGQTGAAPALEVLSTLET